MRERTKELIDINKRTTIDTKALQEMLSCGRPAAIKAGTAAGARVQIGRRVLWNVEKVEQYIDSISQ